MPSLVNSSKFLTSISPFLAGPFELPAGAGLVAGTSVAGFVAGLSGLVAAGLVVAGLPVGAGVVGFAAGGPIGGNVLLPLSGAMAGGATGSNSGSVGIWAKAAELVNHPLVATAQLRSKRCSRLLRHDVKTESEHATRLKVAFMAFVDSRKGRSDQIATSKCGLSQSRGRSKLTDHRHLYHGKPWPGECRALR